MSNSMDALAQSSAAQGSSLLSTVTDVQHLTRIVTKYADFAQAKNLLVRACQIICGDVNSSDQDEVFQFLEATHDCVEAEREWRKFRHGQKSHKARALRYLQRAADQLVVICKAHYVTGLSAAMPGKVLPSSHSRNAPPAVDMYVSWSATPA